MKTIFTAIHILLVSFSLTAGVMSTDIEHSSNQVIISQIGEYNMVLVEDGNNFSTPGAPSLPVLGKRYIIPHTSRMISANIDNQSWKTIGYFNILPSQMPVPIGAELIFTPEDPLYYQSDKFFPEDPVVSFSTGNKSGFMIAAVSYCPLRYNPVTGELQILEEGLLSVTYAEGLEEAVYLTSRQLQVFGEDVESFVENSEDVGIYSPYERESDGPTTEYIIVTPAILGSSFEPLIRWKITRGIGARVVTLTWVVNNFPAYDNMESIREFAKTYHQNYGLIYLVLAGDYDNLGARIVPVNCGTYSDNTPSDLYFSDVVPYTSDWDANNNHIFGEYGVDGCDWYSDIYVGRFPVNTTTEAQRWVSKVLAYEQNPPSGFIDKSIMAGAGLWFSGSYNYYGNSSCDSIADSYLPSNWTDLKMYQSDTISCPPGFSDSLSQGYHWCYIAAHGGPTAIAWYVYQTWPSIISNTTMDNLTNGNQLFVIQSMACQPGWFDNQECVGEHIFNATNGGAIAVMFNARYGWGYPPYLGPSEYTCIRTAEEVFSNQKWNIGRAHGLGKDRLLTWTWGFNNTEHWCINELNLFGDPETMIYSKNPTSLTVNHPDTVFTSSGFLNVDVTSTGAPVQGATCCLCDQYDSLKWFVGITNSSGKAYVQYTLSQPDTLLLTVYAHDYLYYQDTVVVDTGLNTDVLTYWFDNYDSTGSFSWGAAGGYFGIGYRFTPAELAPYDTWYMKKVLFYLTGGSNSANDAHVEIFGNGTSVVPGASLTNVPFTVTGGTGWIEVTLGTDSDVCIDATGDMWVEVGFTPAPFEYPFYACYGSNAVHIQSDMYTDGTTWGFMGQTGISISWAIKVLVEDESGVVEEIGGNVNPVLSLFSVGSVFNSSVEIIYSVPSSGWTELKIYDISGREVRTLVNRHEEKGTRHVILDRNDNNGNVLPSGPYFCRLSTLSGSRYIKIVFVE